MKSWKLTAGLAVLLIVVTAVYIGSNPPSTTPAAQLSDRLFEDLTQDAVTKIEVERPEGGSFSVERATDEVGTYWRLDSPAGQAAEPSLVQNMLYGIDRFLKSGSTEASAETSGLTKPRAVVTFHSAGRRDVLRFGKTPPTNTTIVFYQRDGDPKTYQTSVDTFEAYNKAVHQYRAKTLVRYPPHRVVKLELEYKFLRPQGKGKPDLVEYERSVLERGEAPPERGWYLVKPHREKMDEHRVAGLVSELSGLQAADYQAAGDPKARGFEEPQARITMTLKGSEKPVVVELGGLAEAGKRRWIRVPGSGQEALYDAYKLDFIPLQRKQLRTDLIFFFSPEAVKRFEVEVKDLGRVVIERRETSKEGDPVPTVKWEVLEPAGLKLDPERVEAFVGNVIQQRIIDFLGSNDFKYVGLDPAPIRVQVETKDGRKTVCSFAAAAQGFLRKEGVDEIFEVRVELVRMLQRLELNFTSLEMFNIPREKLREFSFESKVSAQLQPVLYRMKLDPEGKTWAFSDPVHKDQPADPDRVAGLLSVMNYLKAETLIGRDAATIEKYRLDERTAPATLRIVYEGGENEVYFSEDLSDKPTRPMYYARLKDNLAVFQVNPLFIESLKRVPLLKKEGDK